MKRYEILASHLRESPHILYTPPAPTPKVGTSKAGAMQIKDHTSDVVSEKAAMHAQIRRVGTVIGTRSPSPTAPLEKSLSQTSTISLQTLISDKRESASSAPVEAYPATQFPIVPAGLANDEVTILRTQVELLEHKLEELRKTVEVTPPPRLMELTTDTAMAQRPTTSSSAGRLGD